MLGKKSVNQNSSKVTHRLPSPAQNFHIYIQPNPSSAQNWELGSAHGFWAGLLLKSRYCLAQDSISKTFQWTPAVKSVEYNSCYKLKKNVDEGLAEYLKSNIWGYFWRALIFWSRFSQSKKILLYHLWFFLRSWRQRESREPRIRIWLFQTRVTYSDLTFSDTWVTYFGFDFFMHVIHVQQNVYIHVDYVTIFVKIRTWSTL